jgi:signal transduction histidine kinase
VSDESPNGVEGPTGQSSLGSLLIVDDEAPQLRALSQTLEDQGYATVGVSSGEEALRALRGRTFDLLLTDLKMPGIDGITLLREALSIDRQLVGILMTGHGTIATAVEAMQVGALDYILKPFKLSAVLPVLTRALVVRRLRLENAELAQRVRARTVDLEAANRELDAFAFSVSHDLRAPLRAITGFSEILMQDHHASLPPAVQHLLENVNRRGRQGQQLIEALLRFSRLGRQPLSRAPIDVSALVHALIQELQSQEADRHIEVRVNALPEVVADPALLRQVFANLLSNAFKFTRGRESALVEVFVQVHDGEGVFVVRDNGAGFDMRYAGRLFGVFQRFHSQEEFEGTGVGLSLVQRIVHRHGGKVWAESEVDKGARFFFTLGATEAPQAR